jgi:hypothetical protein
VRLDPAAILPASILTPRKTRPLPGCCRPVAVTMPDGRRNPLKIPG